MTKKRKKKGYIRNTLESINKLWNDVAPDIPGLALVNGFWVNKKEIKKDAKKATFKMKKDISSIGDVKALKKWIGTYVMDEEDIDNAIELGKEVGHRVKTGKWFENRNRYETSMQNQSNGSMNALMKRIAELEEEEVEYESYSEDYNEGGFMLRKNIELNRIKLQQQSFGESLELLSPLTAANKAVREMCLFVLDRAAFYESLPVNAVNNDVIKEATDEMKAKVLEVAVPLSKNEATNNTYSEILGTAMAVVIDTEANYIADAPDESNVEELLKKVKETNIELNDSVSPEVAEKFRDRVEDTVEGLSEINDELVFDPVIEEKSELVAAAEKISAAEDFTAIGPIINSVMMVPAIAANVYMDKKNKSFAKKYGTSATIKQPLLASNSLSSETIKQMAKALEVKTALQLKAMLESTMAVMDGGLVNKRLRQANILTPSKIEVKDAKLFAKNPMSYDKILSVFSEGAIETGMFLGHGNTDMLYIIPSLSRHFQKHPENLEIVNCHNALTGRGEAGIELEEKRAALPTYLTVSIQHVIPKDITKFERTSVKNETVIGVSINPKVLNGTEVARIIKNNAFAKVKVDKDERTFIKRFTSILRFWKSDKSSPQGKVLNSNSMDKITEKLSNIKTPLFHIMLEWSDYVELKEQGVDLFNEQTYSTLMSSLPIISITVINEDTGMVFTSEGFSRAFIKKSVSDYVDSTARLEKELRSDIKFRHNL